LPADATNAATRRWIVSGGRVACQAQRVDDEWPCSVRHLQRISLVGLDGRSLVTGVTSNKNAVAATCEAKDNQRTSAKVDGSRFELNCCSTAVLSDSRQSCRKSAIYLTARRQHHHNNNNKHNQQHIAATRHKGHQRCSGGKQSETRESHNPLLG
jgi:hypothetical protein